MEQLRAELSHLLGEQLSRVECVNEKADTALWSLYDSQGNPMPLMARSFTSPGVARQLTRELLGEGRPKTRKELLDLIDTIDEEVRTMLDMLGPE